MFESFYERKNVGGDGENPTFLRGVGSPSLLICKFINLKNKGMKFIDEWEGVNVCCGDECDLGIDSEEYLKILREIRIAQEPLTRLKVKHIPPFIGFPAYFY